MQLGKVFEGWEGYQKSLAHGVAPLKPEQLVWRPSPKLRSLGEVVNHLSIGRITWLARMSPPGIEEVTSRIPRWHVDSDGSSHAVESAVPCDRPEVLLEWLELSWRPIRQILEKWTVDDLAETYVHRFRGTPYRVSRQWTLWRVLSHDVHHGGQIALMLAIQGIDAVELRALGGHIVPPPVAEA